MSGVADRVGASRGRNGTATHYYNGHGISKLLKMCQWTACSPLKHLGDSWARVVAKVLLLSGLASYFQHCTARFIWEIQIRHEGNCSPCCL